MLDIAQFHISNVLWSTRGVLNRQVDRNAGVTDDYGRRVNRLDT